MKKKYIQIKNFIKKHDNIFVIMLIFLSIFGITLNTSITNTDELWNFQNVYKMYNGFQIYKDANIIITPLFFLIGEILFKIFGANFLVFRFYNIFIMVNIYFFTYLILKELKISKKLAVICIMSLIVYKKFGLTLIQANYNTMALMFCLIGIFINFKKYKNNVIYQAIILFLVFITKQNIGLYYGLGLLFYELVGTKKIIEKIKNLFTEILVFLIFFLILILHFYTNNNLYNFINYTVLGISEFAMENVIIEYSSLIAMLFIFFTDIILTMNFLKNYKFNIHEEEKKNLILLNCFSIPLVFIMFPIFNMAHYLIGIHVSLILFIYIAKIMLHRIDFKINNKILQCIMFTECVIVIIISSVYFYFWNIIINDIDYKIYKNSPFYGGIISIELENNINNVVKYIENEKENVIVLSSKAAFYMIPTGRSNGMMDLPFRGNLGKEGEKGLIEKIKNMKNVKILIDKNEDDMIYQESKLARQYIFENMEKIGEIEEFYIYDL